MADTLIAKIDSLNAKISYLVRSTEKIKVYTDYQLEKHEPKNTYIVVICLLAAFLPFFIWAYRSNQKYRETKELPIILTKEYMGNFSWFFGWIWFIGFLCGALYLGGKIHTPYGGFWVSHFDLILAIASLLAIAGAVWAVYARVDAEKAFHKSQETLDALGNSFDFSKILDKDKVEETFDVETKKDQVLSNVEISLYLGFPAIGYLYKHKGTKFTTNTPEYIFFSMIEFLKEINKLNIADKLLNSKIRICVFSETASRNILKDKFGTDAIYWKEKSNDLVKDFYETLNKLADPNKVSHNKKNNDQILVKQGAYREMFDEDGNFLKDRKGEIQKKFVEDFNSKEKFRFVVIDNKGKKPNLTKAIVWIVPDLDNKEGFESACFQTKNPTFIETLENVFST